MFQQKKDYYKVKTKKLKNIDKYYTSYKWVIFSTEQNIIVANKIYNSHHILDYINYEDQFTKTKIDTKIILIGKYHHIISVYHYLKNMNVKVYNIYL